MKVFIHLKTLLFGALLCVSCCAAAQRRLPDERIDLPGSWRCLTPRGGVGNLNVSNQGELTLDGVTSRYSLEGSVVTTTANGVTTQYRVRQAGNALTLEGPSGRYSCQRGGSGSLA